MKRSLSLILVLAMMLSMIPFAAFAAKPTTLYLKPNSNWTQANARFAAYFFGNGDKWVNMTKVAGETNLYSVEVPSGYPNVIFCRMNPSATANNWNNKWNQTGDLTITDGKNLFTIPNGSWDGATSGWSVYKPGVKFTGTNVTSDGAKTATSGTDYTATLTADEGYELSASGITVAVGGKTVGFTFDGSKLTIPGASITAPVTINAVAVEKVVEPEPTEPPVTEPDPTDPPATEPEVEWITVYFRNDWKWSNVCAYYWDANGDNSWPGTPMTFVEKVGENDVYSVQIPANLTGLIFNGHNDGDNRDDQTPNITTGIENGAAWYIHWDGGNKVSKFTYPPVEVAEPVTQVTVHFRNTGLWSDVCYHAWIENGDADKGLTGNWPGVKLTENPAHKNWYTVTLSELEAPNGLGILFNNNNNGSQTEDLLIAKNGEYWYDGKLLESAPDTWADGSVPMVNYQVTLHFADAKNWGSVYLYTWNATGNLTGSWPGTGLAQGSDGFYSMNFTYQAPEGQGLNYIFSGNGQTVDLTLDASLFQEVDGVYTLEKWVVPTSADTEGKFYVELKDAAGAVAISPVVDGDAVTFQYQGKAGDTVQVFGSWNEWKTGLDMTPNEYGVFSCTLDNVAPGIYTYKFVVNGNWISDPLNTWTEGEEQNSAFLICDPDNDKNEVNIVVHYSGVEADGINLCAWGVDGLDAQYNFTNGETTITIDDARSAQYVAFKIRQSTSANAWAKQTSEIKVDLSKILSGTIHVYVKWENLDQGNVQVSQSMDADVVLGSKLASLDVDYDNNTFVIRSTQAVKDPQTAFVLYRDGQAVETTVTALGNAYTLSFDGEVKLPELYRYTVCFTEDNLYPDKPYSIAIDDAYASDRFAEEFTYEGDDLGVAWTKQSTKFVLWAPTATEVCVNLYKSGNAGANDALGTVAMTQGINGTWTAVADGDLNGVYYTYTVTRDGITVHDVVDPYARTTGVNGNRGMVIDLDSTDPTDGWSEISEPASYTDAIIYELHVRDFSIDDSSGVKDEWQGKYLALTQEGTKTSGGSATGLDYLKDLGITHLHLLPIYDYASVNETTCKDFNWGYDPQNYNAPEGSYSTNPYDGEVRVEELKETVDVLHENNIGVIMDVVYNHVYDAGSFCMNQIVPGYFSRPDGSAISGCGNDTASEREMVRKYIVDSVLYWAQEYHLDGFRFDLVGLLDVETINEIVETVHTEYRDDVIFYGEGWDMDSTNKEPGTEMAKQGNASKTEGFGYFADGFRDTVGAKKYESNGVALVEKGFVSGKTGIEEDAAYDYLAKAGWTSNPTQVVQYVSCHDNYSMADKLVISQFGKDKNAQITTDIVKMNNLAAAMYLTAQGVSFIHAGEEMLREKLDSSSPTGRCENSYNASDEVNKIRWSNLDKEIYDTGLTYADNVEYYKGLIEFRKNHSALRLTTAAEVEQYVKYQWVTNEVISFVIDGKSAGDIADDIFIVFNASTNAANVTLPETGAWTICVNGTKAGTKSLGTAETTVSVPARSAMVLVKGKTAHTESDPVIEKETKATCTTDGYFETVVYCTDCGEELTRTSSVAAALGHDHQAVEIFQPTCTEGGYTTYVCANNCGDSYRADETEATGHRYEGGVCVGCGGALDSVTITVMDAGESLALGVQFPENAVEDAVYVEMSHTEANGDGTIVEVAREWWDLQDGVYTVYFTDIASTQMCDEIVVNLYDAAGNTLNKKDEMRFTVREHAIGMLQDENVSAAVKTMYMDMLNYGAAAQAHFGYNAENPANAGLEAYQEYASKSVTIDNKQVKGTGYSSTTLEMEGELQLNLLFSKTTVKKTMYAVITITDKNGDVMGEYRLEGSSFKSHTNNRWRIEIPGLSHEDYDYLITCEIYNGSTRVAYATDSVGSYLSRAVNGGGGALYEKALRFCQSAKAVAENN